MTVYVPGLTEANPKNIIRSLQQLASGRSNAVGSVTLTASASSTTVTDQNCGAGTTPILVPTTANAAAEIKNGTIYISAVAAAGLSFTITHANNAQIDRTYLYALLG